MKFLKKLFIFLLVVIVLVAVAIFFVIKAIEVEVTDADLPQAVYQEDGNLLLIAQTNLLGIIIADESDQYTIIEEFMNYVLLDSIRTNINPNYDPLDGDDTNEANYVVDAGYFFIDYVYAELNDQDQIVVCISFGSNQFMEMHSALYLTFDVDIQIELLDVSVVLTLVEYSIADHGIPFKVLDYLMTRMDKESIEDSMTNGELDLDEYTFTITFLG